MYRYSCTRYYSVDSTAASTVPVHVRDDTHNAEACKGRSFSRGSVYQFVLRWTEHICADQSEEVKEEAEEPVKVNLGDANAIKNALDEHVGKVSSSPPGVRLLLSSSSVGSHSRPLVLHRTTHSTTRKSA